MNAVTPVYLDNNATTRIDPRVVQVMADSYRAGHVNPASPHQAGRRARRTLEAARETIGRLLGCEMAGFPGDRVVFTSGGTEANNLAVLGLAGRRPGRVIVSSVEHPSVLGPAERLRELDFDVRLLRVTREGVVDVEHLHQVLTDDTRLVSVMLGNNETGVLQPVAEIAAVCGDRGVPVHTDAVQAVGKIPVDFRALGVAALTVTPHKFHGPPGIGALLLRESTGLEPTLFGGFQQAGVRPGTECVTLCEGFAEALRLAYDELPGRTEQLTRLRDRFERVLSAEFPELVINGAGTPRLPHTSNLSLPGWDRQALLMALDAAGVACSTGSACASGSSQPSPVLIAMGLPTNVVESSLRFSLGADTTDGDMAQAIQRISRVFRELRKL